MSASMKGVSLPSSKVGQVGPLTMQHCRDEGTRGAVSYTHTKFNSNGLEWGKNFD